MNFARRSALLAGLLAVCSAAMAADTVRVNALDCVFEIPADYEIDVAPNSSMTMSAPGNSLGARITVSELDPAFPSTESVKLLSRVVTGPLTVERFSYEKSGDKASPSIPFTIVRGRRQQAKFDAMPDAQVDAYVAQCLKSITPAVSAAAARKSAGCTSTLPLVDVTAAMGEDVRPQPVFTGGELKGWRLYGTWNSAQLRAHGIREGSLMTRVCAVPAREIFVNDANACCEVDTSKKFDVTFQRANDEIQVSINR
jgi:hypothetical protein